MTLQNSLANYSFLTLLGSMIFYWIETSFHGLNLVELVSKGKTNQPPFDSKKINWKLSTTSKPIFNFFGYTSPEQKVPAKSFSPIKKGSLAKYSLLLSNILLGLLLLLRWKESGHFPLSNLYESLMFLSWCFTGLHLYIDNYTSLPKFLSGLPFAKKQLEEAGSISSSLSKANGVTEREVGVSVSAPLSSFTFGSEMAKEGTSSPGDGGTELLLIRGGASALTNPLGDEKRTKEFQTELEKENEYNEFVRKLVGSITTPSALLTNAFATFTLPKEMQEVSPLVPALQSNWLMMHVTVMILSYAALILGSLMSIAFLIVTIPNNSSSLPSTRAASLKSVEETSLEESNRLLNLNSAQTTPIFNTKNSQTQMAFSPGINSSIAFILDNLSYRILGIGFPLLTIGILSGAVWANEAWGSYWSWDPKETWALLTWLIFAIYLHTRLSKGWEGQKPAIIASFGFVVVWMCYLGVNLIGEGLHSYGWIS